jgi:ketosteroid isomerase-like protein
MSQSDVEIVRRGLEAFNRGDIESSLADFAPEAEWHPYLGAVEGRVFRGTDQIGRMLHGFGEEIEGFEVTAEDILDLGDGKVVMSLRAHGRGRGSSADVEAHWAQLWTLRDGRVVRVEAFDTTEGATEAARAVGS